MSEENNKNSTTSDLKKLQKWLGIILFGVAVIILVINVFSRVLTGIKLTGFKSVEGTISKVKETKEIRHGKNRYQYHVYADYEPYGEGSTLTAYEIYDVDYFFSKGEKVKVYFPNGDPDEAIIAKKIFFFYFPIVDSHNAALIAAIVLGGMGFFAFANGIEGSQGDETSKDISWIFDLGKGDIKIEDGKSFKSNLNNYLHDVKVKDEDFLILAPDKPLNHITFVQVCPLAEGYLHVEVGFDEKADDGHPKIRCKDKMTVGECADIFNTFYEKGTVETDGKDWYDLV